MKIDTCIPANVSNIWKTYKMCVLVHNSSVRECPNFNSITTETFKLKHIQGKAYRLQMN